MTRILTVLQVTLCGVVECLGCLVFLGAVSRSSWSSGLAHYILLFNFNVVCDIPGKNAAMVGEALLAAWFALMS
ncbi:MAG: hypothetical protein Q4A82_04360 [Corynebacterium sp.]|nr:hypothetical protein [Corynebacterium sp.]